MLPSTIQCMSRILAGYICSNKRGSEKRGFAHFCTGKGSDQLALVLQLTSETESPGSLLRPLHLPAQAGAPKAAVPSQAAALSH